MRKIGEFSDRQRAEVLEDYFLTLDITSRVMPSGDGWEVWVHDESQVDRAKEELDAYRREPDAARYREASREAGLLRKRAEREEKRHRKNQIDIRKRWERPAGTARPLTFLLIAASVIVGLLTQFGARAEPLATLLTISGPTVVQGRRVLKDDLSDVRSGQVWRLVTPIFLHFSVLHLLFNMFWLYDLGGMVEARQGTLPLLLIVLASAVVSNLAQFYFAGPLFGGMSGVVYALFGYAWMKSRYDAASGLYIHPNTALILIGWFFVCFTPLVPGVANAAHAGGLGVGMALGAAPHVWKRMLEG